MATTRPTVLINMASSLDGKAAPPAGLRPEGFVMSRGAEDHRRMRGLRARADAVVIGAGNLRADDPDLAVDPAERARRRAAGAPEPVRVLVTSRGEGVGPGAKIFDPTLGGPAVVAHAASMPRGARERLAGRARLAELGADRVEVPRLLAWLASEYGCATVLCEGGGELNAEFFAAGAVDEAFVTLVPRVLGGRDAPQIVGGAGLAPGAVPDPRLVSAEQVGGELFLRYAFAWPGGGGATG